MDETETAPAIALTSEIGESSEVVESSENAAVPVVAEAEADRPKSPWTPSYSVITQGPGVEGEVAADDSKEIAELEALEPTSQPQESVEITNGEVAAAAVVAVSAVATEVCLLDTFALLRV